jgi:choline kinase
MNEDIIISYSDIIYKPSILQQLADCPDDFAVAIDDNWKKLWEVRMDNPLSDAETLKIQNGRIIEIGKKPKSYDEIQGQYMGLIKISAKALPKIKEFYHKLDRQGTYDGKNFDNMFMTSFLQMLIDQGLPLTPVKIFGGWLEIDSVEDLEKYTKNNPLKWS